MSDWSGLSLVGILQRLPCGALRGARVHPVIGACYGRTLDCADIATYADGRAWPGDLLPVLVESREVAAQLDDFVAQPTDLIAKARAVHHEAIVRLVGPVAGVRADVHSDPPYTAGVTP